MKLAGMADAVRRQREDPEISRLSFEERLASCSSLLLLPQALNQAVTITLKETFGEVLEIIQPSALLQGG
jgi:hypothetical protein